MGSEDTQLLRRPEAKAESVDDVVARIVRGEVRIPTFQRGLKWQSEDVLDLFDSIYRGFPIGSILLHQGHAPAAEVQVGPLRVLGQESSAALWVVDGQQRLTALAAALARPDPIPVTPIDRYVVYFDAENQSFCNPPKTGEVPDTWVPVTMLRDSATLSEWIHTWRHRDELRKVVFEAGRRIREYPIPLSVIYSDNEEVLRAVFQRVNRSGVGLTWAEVHDALYGHRGAEPTSIAALAARLENVGMGRPSEDELLPCLVALRGLDVTRSLGEHLRADESVLRGAVAAAAPVLGEVLTFLRAHAAIPHLRLLPYATPLLVLTRFFHLHPAPNDRTRTLLVRWIWRSFLGGVHDDRVLKRRGVEAIVEDEERSVQRLLALVPSSPQTYELADHFDARAANSRIALLALAALDPLALDAAVPIDIAPAIRAHDRDVFRPIFPPRGETTRSAANRILLPGRGSAATTLRDRIATFGVDDAVLRSHAIDRETALAIQARDAPRALKLRATRLVHAVNELGERLAEWGRSDRPSIDYLLRAKAS